jgi:protein-disulfide isomerase
MSRLTKHGVAFVMVLAAAGSACAASAGDAEKEKARSSKPAPGKAAGPLAPSSPVALIGDRAITLQEVDAEANLTQVRQQEYEVRKQALERMLVERLLEKEAAARGIEPEDLLQREVADKVADPTDAEVAGFYEKNKARYGSQTLEQATPQIAIQLRAQKLAEAQRAYHRGLRQKHGVKVLLEPPRVEVAVGDDAARGPARAPVTIVAFSDYQCPYCSRAEVTIDEVLKRYGDKVRLVYRHYPLRFHNNAEHAAMAAECAGEQGKFWDMHKAMFSNQQKLSPADLVATAAGLGLDKDAFKSCLDSGKHRPGVQKDFEDGQSYGVTGTPTFFINGIPIVGARGLDSFVEIIDSELERVR